MSKKILFIDRDGTLVKEPADFQVDDISKIRLCDGVIPALLHLKQAGYRFVMVSNQDGLGTPSFPQTQFDTTHQFIIDLFESQGIQFSDTRICPHFEKDNCDCRKPKIGLVQDYVIERRFDRDNSYVIGDRKTDLALADNMGIQGFLLGEQTTWDGIAKQILTKPRVGQIMRNTAETNINLCVNLDEQAKGAIDTPCQFLNHMLEQIEKHAGIQLSVTATGDMAVDDHHLVEDIAICLGQAMSHALSDRRGLGRYGFTLPMDESLANAVIDLSGRADFIFSGQFPQAKVSDLSTEMVPHFFKTFSHNLGATLHLSVEGSNTHHMVEACFKAVARALGQAIKCDGIEMASTKGCL